MAAVIGTTLLPLLLRIHKVCRSYDGTTCWGLLPGRNVETTFFDC